MNRLMKTSSWRGIRVPRTGDAVTRVVVTRDQDANVPTAHATGQLLRIPVFLAPTLPQPVHRLSLDGGQQPFLMPMIHLLAKSMVLLI